MNKPSEWYNTNAEAQNNKMDTTIISEEVNNIHLKLVNGTRKTTNP
jgi:hypothetical protein